MADAFDNPELMNALADLEVALETPFVPGELESWAQDVQRALVRVDPLLRKQISEVNAAMLEEIETEDAGLLSRVADLRERDQKSLSELETLLRTLGTLNEIAGEVEPDETKLKSQLDELARSGLALVISVRTQLVSLRTWLQEAFDRDRGTVD